ncbi:iron ABC transporter permease [Actinomycetaceae bacterium L2_0104]
MIFSTAERSAQTSATEADDGDPSGTDAFRSNPASRARKPRLRQRRGLILALLMLLIIPTMIVSLVIGSRVVSMDDAFAALQHFDPSNDDHLVIRNLRVPRTILAVLAGAALGLAGALMQSLTRNTLAEPGTLGVNSGAAAGVVLGLAFTGSASIVVYVWFAFAGAGIASLLVHRLGHAGESGVNPVRLVLAGAGLSIMLSSVTTMVILSSPQAVFDSFRNWSSGSLQGRGWEVLPVTAVSLGVGLLLAMGVSGSLNSISLGSDMARGLGVNVRRTWAITNLAILLLAGAATAAIGPVAFIGLAAPHIARSLVGPDHRWLLPYSAVIAGLVLLVADIAGRAVIHPAEVGAGVMSAIIGAPFFIYLIRRGRVEGL